MAHIVEKVAPGITLHTLKESRFKSTVLSFHYFMPDSPQLTAALNILPFYLENGSQKHPSRECINNTLEELYGADIIHAVKRWGNTLEICFTVDSIGDKFIPGNQTVLKPLFDLTVSMLYEPILDPKHLSWEKQAMIESIKSLYNAKESYAIQSAGEHIFPTTSFSRPKKGTIQDVEALSIDSVKEAYQYFLKNATLHIYYAGDMEHDTLKTWCQPLCEYHGINRKQSFGFVDTPPHKRGEVWVESADTEQSQVVVAYTVPQNVLSTQKDGVFSLYKAIMSTSPIAKLFKEVREANGLCYSCNLLTFPAYGVWMVIAGVKPGREEEAATLIRGEFAKMQLAAISPKEFTFAKRHVLSALQAVTGSHSRYENYYFGRYMQGKCVDTALAMQSLESVTVDDVIALSQDVSYAGTYFLKGTFGEVDK